MPSNNKKEKKDKKYQKEESSDMFHEDKPVAEQTYEEAPQFAYVYHDPAVFEDAQTHQEPEHHSKDSHDADVFQDANQVSLMEQDSEELIFIKDSCNICVHTTNTQAAVSLQIALQLAIALVLRVTILDSDQGQNVAEDLLQYFDSEQNNFQKISIVNSKDINITTTDTDVAANIQALLQVLLTLVAKVDIA
ncbi:spore coat protein [Neobacillus sp. 3P2-tot-E-2]|uniref:spore coat protein n=1 Tax=Neobacillus sp. 3P2-tot-E-2 TaxID=3132212 RepID=UPI0039A3C367